MGKVTRPPVTQPNDTWALDFLHDTLADGSEVRQPGKLVQNAHIENFNGTLRHRWQRFHEWRLVDESQEPSEELLASTCNPPPKYVLCSGEREQFGTGWISSCNSLPYRCFHE